MATTDGWLEITGRVTFATYPLLTFEELWTAAVLESAYQTRTISGSRVKFMQWRGHA